MGFWAQWALVVGVWLVAIELAFVGDRVLRAAAQIAALRNGLTGEGSQTMMALQTIADHFYRIERDHTAWRGAQDLASYTIRAASQPAVPPPGTTAAESR